MLSFRFISSFHFLSRVCLLLYVYDEWCMCSSKTYLIFFLRDSFFCYSSVKLAVVVEKKKSKKKTDCTDQELSRKKHFLFRYVCVQTSLSYRQTKTSTTCVVKHTELHCTFFFFLVCVSLDYCFITFIVIIITATTRETTTIKTDTHFYTHIQASP